MRTNNQIIFGDSRQVLQNFPEQIDLIVTSPPYADARKNHYDSMHPDQYTEWFLTFHEPFFTALKHSGSLIINIKDKVVDGVRHRYVWNTINALSDLGWYAIEDYIWHKTNPMPGFWPTRLRDGWEYCFHLSKDKRPYINFEAVKQPIGDWSQSRLAKLGKNDSNRHNSENKSGFGRNISKWVERDTVLPGNVLSIPLVGKNMGHPAVFPIELPRFFIKLLSPENGIILDPFAGSGTTGIAAHKEGRKFVLVDNNEEYCRQAGERLKKECDLDVPVASTKNYRLATPKKVAATLF